MKSLCKSWCFKCFGGCQVGGRWGLEREYFRPFVSFRTFLLRGTFPLCYFPPLPGSFLGISGGPRMLSVQSTSPSTWTTRVQYPVPWRQRGLASRALYQEGCNPTPELHESTPSMQLPAGGCVCVRTPAGQKACYSPSAGAMILGGMKVQDSTGK